MKRVYTADSLIDGQLVIDLLTNAGVPCLLFNQSAAGGLGDLPVTYPEVWVKRNRDTEKPRVKFSALKTARHRQPINHAPPAGKTTPQLLKCAGGVIRC